MSEDIASTLPCNVPYLEVCKRAEDTGERKDVRTRIMADSYPVAIYFPSGEKDMLQMTSLFGGTFVVESSTRTLAHGKLIKILQN